MVGACQQFWFERRCPCGIRLDCRPCEPLPAPCHPPEPSHSKLGRWECSRAWCIQVEPHQRTISFMSHDFSIASGAHLLSPCPDALISGNSRLKTGAHFCWICSGPSGRHGRTLRREGGTLRGLPEQFRGRRQVNFSAAARRQRPGSKFSGSRKPARQVLKGIGVRRGSVFRRKAGSWSSRQACASCLVLIRGQSHLQKGLTFWAQG